MRLGRLVPARISHHRRRYIARLLLLLAFSLIALTALSGLTFIGFRHGRQMVTDAVYAASLANEYQYAIEQFRGRCPDQAMQILMNDEMCTLPEAPTLVFAGLSRITMINGIRCPTATLVVIDPDLTSTDILPLAKSFRDTRLYSETLSDGREIDGAIAMSTFFRDNRLANATLVSIAADGMVPWIIKGMRLDLPANRWRFPAIQFQMRTWSAGDEDERRPWTRFETIWWLEHLGYRVYMIGCNEFARITPEYFRRSPLLQHSVRGDFLAVSPDAHPALLQHNFAD